MLAESASGLSIGLGTVLGDPSHSRGSASHQEDPGGNGGHSGD